MSDEFREYFSTIFLNLERAIYALKNINEMFGWCIMVNVPDMLKRILVNNFIILCKSLSLSNLQLVLLIYII